MTFTVQAKQCATCIYRADSPLDLKRLEAAIADPRMDGFFTGHPCLPPLEDGLLPRVLEQA